MASEKDIQDIINTLIAEGVGEGEEGMRRIAETILNRAEQRGISPAEVVRQRAQYTGYSAPGPGAVKAQRDPAAISAAQAAWEVAQGPDDPTGGANHYWNPNIVNPSWAGSMTSLGQYGNHAFATDRPVQPPRLPPSPASLSPAGAAIRQMTSPSGGNSDLQAALDRVATRERNRVTPAIKSQGPFNGDPLTPASGPVVASIPTLPKSPTTRPVATSIIRPSASDLVRGNPQQTKNVATTIASYPTKALPKPFSYAGQDASGQHPKATTIASYPTKPQAPGMSYAGQEGGAWPQAFPTTAQITAATGFRPPPTIPDRLPQGVAGMPALYGVGNVAGVGTKAVAPMPFVRPPAFAPTQMAQGKVAPVPFNRPTAVGSQLSVKPMPPMPIPRPPMGMGGPEMPAPFPAQMSPLMALQRAIPKLRPPTSPAAQKVWMTGFSDSGSSGGAHGGSDKDKHPGVSYNIGRSY
jgi:hypothetical protein